MVALDLVLDGTFGGNWAPGNPESVQHVTAPLMVVGLPPDSQTGTCAVLLKFTLATGEEVIAEIPLRHLLMAAAALKARYGELSLRT